ncbi:MAG: fluoride efflux transporter CrcB [Anditalea sp.]
MIKTIILVGLGGGLGSIFRYLTAVFVNKHFSFIYPLATFMVNFIGCFLIGLLLGLFERQYWTTPDLKFLLVVGFCGGYTTFSTFAFENLSLFQSNHTLVAFAYIALSVLTGLFATWLGLYVVK